LTALASCNFRGGVKKKARELGRFYNDEIPHSALGYKNLEEYYNGAAVYQKGV